MDRLLLTPEETAQMLRVGRSTVYELIASGRLKSVKIGRCRRVTRAQVDEFVLWLSGSEAA